MLATGKLANARKIRTSVPPEPALAFVLFIVFLRPSMSDKRSEANFQIFPFLEGRCDRSRHEVPGTAPPQRAVP